MKKIQNGSKVSVNYTGKLEDGQVFDSSLMDGRTPLQFTIGEKTVIPGFENGLIDMSVGDKKTVEISPEDAYGQSRQELVFEVEKDQIPDGVQVGDSLQTQSPQGQFIVKVVEIKEDKVVMDGNHPLAGKKLIFDLEVVDVD